jgi:hypothetical protein
MVLYYRTIDTELVVGGPLISEDLRQSSDRANMSYTLPQICQHILLTRVLPLEKNAVTVECEARNCIVTLTPAITRSGQAVSVPSQFRQEFANIL